MVLIATLSPGDGKIIGNHLDKIAHFLIFCLLATSILYKFKNSVRGLELLLWCVLFSLFTEVCQQFIPGRTMEFYDGVADTLGIISGYYLYKNHEKKAVHLEKV